ncbi:MAG TPA: molybdenum cofactor biosynthesis protein, partial [Desulfobulbus sp.]|nr:molybdenum cofactor biosynthesis protein [Desulfobulbus sp.]
MDISKTIAELKERADFTDNVGMILIHNGTVRNWSRADRRRVVALETRVDHDHVEKLR